MPWHSPRLALTLACHSTAWDIIASHTMEWTPKSRGTSLTGVVWRRSSRVIQDISVQLDTLLKRSETSDGPSAVHLNQ
eukprot:7182499-Pyramimonas_sp.AAC.1